MIDPSAYMHVGLLLRFLTVRLNVGTPAGHYQTCSAANPPFDAAEIKQLVWRSRNNTRIVSQIRR